MSQKIKTSVEIDGSLTASQIANATTDTDKFLVSDGGTVKYRTGAELAADLGISAGTTSKVQHQVKAGVAINTGQAVYVTSADGTNMIVGLASNASEATSSKTMGLLNATVAANGFADVITEGLLAGLDTSTATIGNPVWLGTNGNLIYGLPNKPYAPNHLVFIGIVTRVNANNGEIFVKVQNGFELDELHDVDLKTTTPVNGHILGHNGTLWVNKTIAGWLGYTPYNASNPAGYISSYTETDTLQTVTDRGSITTNPITINSTSLQHLTLNNRFNLIGSENFHISNNAYYSSGFKYKFAGNASKIALNSDNSFVFQTAATGTPDATVTFENKFWADSAGNALSTGSMRSPIFYDYNDTSYYTDPAGASILNGLKLVGAGDNASGTDYTLWIQGSSLDWGIGVNKTSSDFGVTWNLAASHAYGLQGLKNGTEYFRVGTDLVLHDAQMRAPIFYDYNNTAYYVDPASTSNLNALTLAGTFSAPGYNKTNWDTAYGWGNHASAGYVPASRTITINGTSYDLSANRSWTVTGTETDTLATVTGRGNTTTSNISANGVRIGRNFSLANRAAVRLDSNGDYPAEVLFGRDVNYADSSWNGVYWSLSSRGSNESNSFRLYRGIANTGTSELVVLDVSTGGSVVASGDFRAPIFYDSNDTSFYTDPASTSNLNKLRITSAGNSSGGNILMGPAGEGSSKWSYLTGTHYNATSQPQGVSIIGLYTSSIQNAISIGGNIYEANPATEINFYTHNAITQSTGGSRRMYIDSGGNVVATSNIQAPIFYDSNDTTFYVDQNSASKLRNLYVGNSGNSWVDSGGWGTQFQLSNGPHSIMRIYARDESIETGMFSHVGGQSKAGSLSNHNFSIVRNFADRMTFYDTYTYSNVYMESAGSMRSPIFYDSNDTSYYADFNSTSDSAIRVRGGMLMGPNPTWGAYLQVGGNGNNTDYATVVATDGNLHMDAAVGKAMYLNYYHNGIIYLNGTTYSISSNGSYYNGTASYANSAASADQIDGWPFANTGSNSGTDADTLNSNGITYYSAGVPNFTGNASDGALYSQAYNSNWQHQIAGDYRSGQIALRGRNSGTWQSWRTVLDSSNYTTYAPTKTGSGASGTWGINITGSAGSAFGMPYDGSAITGLGNTANWDSRPGVGYAAFAINNHTGVTLSGYGGYGGVRLYASGYPTHSGSVLRLEASDSVKTYGTFTNDSSVRSPIFYDVNDTGYYWNPAADASHRFQTPSGYIDIGPKNGGTCHIYTDRPSFYFNQTLLVNGNTVWHGGNDGSGSGLDADLIDGIESSRIVYGNNASKVNSHPNANEWRDSGFYENDGGGSNWPSGTWYNSINVRHSNQGNYHGFQVAMSYYDNNLWFRSYNGSGSFQGWQRAAVARGEGTNYVDYSRYVYNNGAYSGSGWVEPSDLGVRYALNSTNAGNADTVDGFHGDTFFRNLGFGSGYPSWNANTIDESRSGFTYANGAPHSGCIAHFGASGYGIQLNGNYGGDTFAMRSRNGDNGTWRPWKTLYTDYNMDAPNKSGTSYYQTNTWMQFNGSYGLYWPNNNGTHIHSNDGSSYTQVRLQGSKNNWGGIYDSHSGVNGFMYDSGGNGGIYREANGRWFLYHHVSNNCTAISTSTTSSSYRAYVGGSLYAEGDIVAYSDRRKKENIVTVDGALDKVNKLRGVYYNRIDDDAKKRQVGVIAQEIQEVLPEVVTYAEDVDEYGVSYGNITGLLIEAIKEQQTQIEELKELVKTLINK